jgi:hypothetical protein
MSEPDAVPLPREGEVFFDVRGESRTMRLSWYADSSVAVFSIWQGNRCAGTFRLPFGDLVRMVETLEAGPPSRGASQGAPHRGEPSYPNAGPDPGYGYPEPAGYGPPTTYAHQPGYGAEPNYGTGPGYGYGPEPGYDAGSRPDGAGGRASGHRYDGYEPAAASHGRGQGYAPGHAGGHGAPERYGAQEYDSGPRYVPDVAGAAGTYQRRGPDYGAPADGPRTAAYERNAGYSAVAGYQEQESYAAPPEYAEQERYPQRGDYRDEYAGGYRGETQFLAAPPAQADYRDGPRTAAWRDERPRPSGERDPGDFPAGPAKTEQVTSDWGPATASYRAP